MLYPLISSNKNIKGIVNSMRITIFILPPRYLHYLEMYLPWMNEWIKTEGLDYILTEKRVVGVSVLVRELPYMCQSKDWDYIRQDSWLQAAESYFYWFKQKEICWTGIVWGTQCSHGHWKTAGPGLKRSKNPEASRWSWWPQIQMSSGERKVWHNRNMAWVWMRKMHR